MALALAAGVACSGREAQTAGATAASAPASASTQTSASVTTSGPAATAHAPGIELPAGPGRDLLVRDCLDCHNLGGLELFSAFYTRDDWLVLVQTMIAHGARTDAAEAELVADYLALHFGPR